MTGHIRYRWRQKTNKVDQSIQCNGTFRGSSRCPGSTTVLSIHRLTLNWGHTSSMWIGTRDTYLWIWWPPFSCQQSPHQSCKHIVQDSGKTDQEGDLRSPSGDHSHLWYAIWLPTWEISPYQPIDFHGQSDSGTGRRSDLRRYLLRICQSVWQSPSQASPPQATSLWGLWWSSEVDQLISHQQIFLREGWSNAVISRSGLLWRPKRRCPWATSISGLHKWPDGCHFKPFSSLCWRPLDLDIG